MKRPRLHDRIREIMERSPHLTQKGLAERMGVNPAAVNRMLHGQRNIMAEEIPVIERYLGARLTPGEHAAPPEKSRSAAEVSLQPALIPTPIPAYRLDGKGFSAKDVADWVPRHPVQLGSRDAFAVYAVSDAMAPRYFSGELAYIHPGRPPEPGRDVLIVPKKGAPFLARFVRETNAKLRVAFISPAREKDIMRAKIRAAYAVVGRG
jgi:transcriptional regulator with XRE-family HTH domain